MSTTKSPASLQSSEIKQSCACLYESDVAKLLLGESFHPGGLKLTQRLGELLSLGPGTRVLDVASGKGTSAMFLAERFGCEVVGIDYGDNNMQSANTEASARGLGALVRFQKADAESLPFPDGSFDAVVCECAFCTFPDKALAAREFARVLRDGGRLGLSDLTRSTELPAELRDLLAWIACIADAQTLESYIDRLRSAGLVPETTEAHAEDLTEMVRQIQGKLFAAEVMTGLKKIDLPGTGLAVAKQMAKAAFSAIQNRQLGYAIVIAQKPQCTG